MDRPAASLLAGSAEPLAKPQRQYDDDFDDRRELERVGSLALAWEEQLRVRDDQHSDVDLDERQHRSQLGPLE